MKPRYKKSPVAKAVMLMTRIVEDFFQFSINCKINFQVQNRIRCASNDEVQGKFSNKL